MSFLPFINNKLMIEDGTCYHVLPFCKKNCGKEKCQKHYNDLLAKESGSYCCPYGLSSYVYAANDKKYIFTGLKIRGVYVKEKAKQTAAEETIYNPIIDESVCASIAKEIVVSFDEKHELEIKLDAIRDLLHETRSLNGQVKDSIDLLWSEYDEESIPYNSLLMTIKKAHVSSYMIANRFSYFDSVLNPSISIGSPYYGVVFKRFDKMRKLLKDYMRKNVWISISSDKQCDYRFNLYPTFDTLLFILLENAIKYSPNNNPVDIILKEYGSKLDVTISSIGPYCDENELLMLCKKGFRGQNATAVQPKGQGFGLNFAKKICEQHNIGVSFNSIYSHKDHSVKYGTFVVTLEFDNNQ